MYNAHFLSPSLVFHSSRIGKTLLPRQEQVRGHVCFVPISSRTFHPPARLTFNKESFGFFFSSANTRDALCTVSKYTYIRMKGTSSHLILFTVHLSTHSSETILLPKSTKPKFNLKLGLRLITENKLKGFATIYRHQKYHLRWIQYHDAIHGWMDGWIGYLWTWLIIGSQEQESDMELQKKRKTNFKIGETHRQRFWKAGYHGPCPLVVCVLWIS